MSQDPLEIPDNLIEIEDPELDPANLMAEIRRRIHSRREELGYAERHFPLFGAASQPPEPPADRPYSQALYQNLRQLNKRFAEMETAPVLAPSPATRIPVLGRLWQLVRSQAHGLILFYVNRAVAHEVTVNGHLVNIINELVRLNQEQQMTIGRLEAELAELRQARSS